MLLQLQIAEESNHEDKSEMAVDDVAGKASLRVQFADDVDDSQAPDMSTVKDGVLLQPRTTEDGYLSPTTRTTSDDLDTSYLGLVESPTDTTTSFALSPAHIGHVSCYLL